MNYPLISEYVEAIKSAEISLKELNYLRPVLDEAGNPVMSSGNFAVVFKMQSNYPPYEYYALKCFTKEQAGRNEAYKKIREALKDIHSNYLVYFDYYENELFVDTKYADVNEFPVLLMDWIEGVTLDNYIRQNINDQYILGVLAYRFSKMAEWLLNQPFAHGDLKPDNILIRQGCQIVLIDYDGMYVPSMAGEKAREIGSPDFQHPERTDNSFNTNIDDFSLVSILLSLKAVSLRPSLLILYGAKDRLLLSRNDYLNIKDCSWIGENKNADKEYDKIVSLLQFALSQKDIAFFRPEAIALTSPHYHLEPSVTDYDKETAEEDEYGNVYSKDGIKLIKGVGGFLREGIKVICSNAFHNDPGEDLTIPEGVEVIGDDAFSFQSYFDDPGFHWVNIPSTVRNIGNGALWKCCFNDIKSPFFKEKDNNVYSQNEDRLLRGNNGDISRTVKSIDRGAFYYSSIESVTIPYGVSVIDSLTFDHCKRLKTVQISETVTDIKYYAFADCSQLQTIIIPPTVRNIEDSAFSDCSGLRTVIIPNTPIRSFHITTKLSDHVEGIYIGREAFEGCHHLRVFYSDGTEVTDYKHYFFGGVLDDSQSI